MSVQERLYTAAEFWGIAHLPENADKHLELLDGIIIEMPPSSQKNAVIAARIVYLLNTYVIPRDLGYVTGADGGYTITDHNAFQPDAAFISKTRHSALEGVAFPVAPDLAVEVISPSESSNDVLKKVRRYLAAGTRQVWTVYPEDTLVYVWKPGGEDDVHMQVVDINGSLSGEDALPGFTLTAREIFIIG